MNLRKLTLVALLFAQIVLAAPFGNPKAPKGGTFTIGYPSYPSDLLMYLAFDELSAGINALIIESLLDQNPNTNEFIPGLAAEWKISPDKKVFTFTMDKNAKFSDGKPVTAEDVKFTFDTVTNPKNKTAPFQADYASIESCVVKDPQTVEFRAKNLHFKNFEKVASLMVLPKHFFSQGDFNRAFHTKILGSGPYTLESIQQGEKIVLRRDPNYWAATQERNQGLHNFDRIVFRAVPDPNVSFELFKRGDLDYFYFLSSKMWSTDTNGAPFTKNWIKKLKVENLSPTATQGIAWNMRKPIFQDRRVRLAMSHLMDRERWIKELFYNNYIPATGAIASKSEYHSPKNTAVPYDPKKARALLKEAGWDKVGTDGVLIKDGNRFEFDLLTDSPGSERYLTRYQEDLKKVGIKMNIRVLDWATAIKLTDDRQFDAREVARGRDVEPSDFAVTWGSKQADIKGSANLVGYKNPELDKLAQEVDETFDRKKRVPLVQRIDEIIGYDQPMSFAWEATFVRLGHWNRYSFPEKGYFKYSTWKSVFYSWWLDNDKDAKLKAARAKQAPLPN
jgi:microcin C transport system substrate-binding protein